jgi:hypothetical protein
MIVDVYCKVSYMYSVHVEVQNRCDAILRAFLIVGMGFL